MHGQTENFWQNTSVSKGQLPSLLSGSCALRRAFIAILRLRRTALAHQDVRIAVMRDSLDVATNEARALGFLLIAQRADLRQTVSQPTVPMPGRVAEAHHIEVMAHEAVPAHRAPVARSSEGPENARAREEGQVEAVLGVPPRGWPPPAHASVLTTRSRPPGEHSPQPALVALKSAHQSHVKPTHCAINASTGPSASVDHPHTTGTTPSASRRYLRVRQHHPNPAPCPLQFATFAAQYAPLLPAIPRELEPPVQRSEEGEHHRAVRHLDVQRVVQHRDRDARVDARCEVCPSHGTFIGTAARECVTHASWLTHL